MRVILVSIVFLIAQISVAQTDKAAVFTPDKFIWYVQQFHPIASQAKLVRNNGDSRVREAKGGFDPKLMANWNEKQFETKEYYTLMDAGLRIPTWYGLQIESGYDQNSGRFLNPQNELPTGGLWTTGLSFTVGQGLIIDKRRASLFKAKIYQESTQFEQQNMLNQLYFDAFAAYWSWVKAWNSYNIYIEALGLAEERFKAVKQSFVLGDVPAIDTLEAYLQVQNRLMNKTSYELEYKNSALKVSNFLWTENNVPLELDDSIKAPSYRNLESSGAISDDSLSTWLEAILKQHPEMKLYDYKLQGLDIDRRLQVEGLKPTLDLKYNVINTSFGNPVASAFSDQNYTWGFKFGFPVFLREQRGQLQQTDIEIETVALSREQKSLQLQNKLRTYANEVENLDRQIRLFRSVVSNYERLLQGEREKFNAGESSLFLVNSRETNLITSRLKLASLLAQSQVARAGVSWSAGMLAQRAN